ncbi:MAG: zinc ribbon domain-containing protein, partial [Microcoleus sp.]
MLSWGERLQCSRDKVFKCPECGYVADRDANGAFGIMLKALAGTPFTLAGDAIEV